MSNIIKIMLNKPGLSIASACAEQSSKGIQLTEKEYHENGFSELEISLFDDYYSLLVDVENENLIDFDPDWVLNEFMLDNFGTAYKQDEKAMLFYNRIDQPWLEIFTEEQDELLSSK